MKRVFHTKILHRFRDFKLRNLDLALLVSGRRFLFSDGRTGIYILRLYGSILRLKSRNILHIFLGRNILDHFFLYLVLLHLFFYFGKLFIRVLLLSVKDIPYSFGYFFLKAFRAVHISFVNKNAFNYRRVFF